MVRQDVIVDAGRLGLVGWPQPLIAASDLTLLVTRNSLPALAGARSWAKALRDQFATVGGLSRLGALLVDEDGRWPTVPTVVPRVRPYTARQIAKALQIPIPPGSEPVLDLSLAGQGHANNYAVPSNSATKTHLLVTSTLLVH